MNHLDDFTLNEYLDHTLNTTERHAAESHLSTCAACRTALDKLQMVFAELDALPEAPLAQDLTPSIIERLPQKYPYTLWTRSFAAQLGAALGVMYWLVSQAIPYIRTPRFVFPKLPALNVQPLFTRLLSVQFEIPDFYIPEFRFQLPALELQVPSFALEISGVQTIGLGVSVFFLWVVSNVILLRSRQETR